MKNYMSFVKGAFIKEDTVNNIINYYENSWKMSQGMTIEIILKSVYRQLERDITYSLYGDTLKKVHLFSREHNSLYPIIATLFKREYHIKDTQIVQCNDVQGKIYVVYEGRVKIVIANTDICYIEEGGIFGCFTKQGVTRQTLTATAVVHSTLLSVDSSTLQKNVAIFPKVVKRIR